VTACTVLVVEDDRPLAEALACTLETAGFAVLSAADGGEALEILDRATVDIVVTDVQMAPVDGRELLRRLKDTRPALPVLMMTAYGTIEQAVAAMQEGAADYLVKPFEADELEQCVARYIRPRVDAGERSRPVAVDPRSVRLLELAEKVALSDVTVLLTGESGTGKEVLARFIHASSARREHAMIALNCAAIPDQMLEAILFGHEKGAFTGAQARSVGKFIQADRGTLLLDEITEMDIGLQAKLLRVLQEREVEPLGASKPVPVDVRVIATSNRDLEAAVREGVFREDLYYRLSVFPIEIPPLRERPGDIEALARHLIARQGAGAPKLSRAAVEALCAHLWPGNVRELGNVVQRALVLAQGRAEIDVEHLVLERAASFAPAEGLAEELWEEESRRIVDALNATNGSRKDAAAKLGISPRTLRYKLAKIRGAGLAVPGDRAGLRGAA
jgi:two-component system response regulator FlrC